LLYNGGMNSQDYLDAAEEARSFLSDTKKALDGFIIPHRLYDVVDAVFSCKGVIVTTGLGKAGHVARKCSSSLCSLGMQSCFLNPAEASHGDVGIIREDTMLIVFSTSGKTREILETMDLARKLSVGMIVAVTSHPESPVREASDIVLDMGDIKEAGHLGLAPTTSILIMLIIADMLALCCSRVRNLTKEEFGLRHHGGYLGKKCRGEEP